MLFRADTLSYAGQFFLTMLGVNGSARYDAVCLLYLRENAVLLALAVLFSGGFALWFKERLTHLHPGGHNLSLLWDLLYTLGMACIAVLSAACLVKGTYNPFIYFRF